MKSRFSFLLKRSKKTLEEIASEAGYTVDYIHRLKRDSAKERFNEDTIKAFADALNIYPSEILPLEWQKPGEGELNENLMRDVMRASFRIYAEYGATLKTDWLIDLIILAYKKYASEGIKKNLPVNDNEIFGWMEAKVENLKQASWGNAMDIEADLRKHLAKAIPANTNHKSLKITGIWIVIGLLVAFFSPHNSTNNGNLGIGNQIIINTNQPLRNWQELTSEEKDDLKAQAINKFPEIRNIGSGVNWMPITEWLNSQGVKANSTRDLFRG